MLRKVIWKAVDVLRRRADPVGHARRIGVRVGARCRISASATFGTEPYLVSLGDHVEVTSEVRFVTHDGGVWVFRDEQPDWDVVAPIRVGDNVYIGIRSIILPGVTIGSNCVIGAGSIVTRDVPEGSVAAGVPARVIKTVEGYRRGLEGRVAHTKNLDPEAKRTALLKRLG